VYHKGSCVLGKESERRREILKAKLDRCSRPVDEGEWVLTDQRYKGHEEIAIATGYHNPKDPGDWCYKIHCCCGDYNDIAWGYEEAKAAAAAHRADHTSRPVAKRQSKPTSPKQWKVLY
jgi:hypothetical protein